MNKVLLHHMKQLWSNRHPNGGRWREQLKYSGGVLEGRILLIVVVGTAAILVSGCGAAGISAGSGGGSNRDTVLLVPETHAGWAGWCVLPVGVTGGACGNGEKRAPVIEEHWNGTIDPQSAVGVAVTSDQVARVAIGEGISGDARLLGGK